MLRILTDLCASSVCKNDYKQSECYVTLLELGLNKKTKHNYTCVHAEHKRKEFDVRNQAVSQTLGYRITT